MCPGISPIESGAGDHREGFFLGGNGVGHCFKSTVWERAPAELRRCKVSSEPHSLSLVLPVMPRPKRTHLNLPS